MSAFTQLFGGMTQMWLNVAFIVCVFAVLTFKPERISNLARFKTGCVIFAVSLVVATVSVLFPTIHTDAVTAARAPIAFGLKICYFASILLFAIGFIAVVTSIMPSTSHQSGK